MSWDHDRSAERIREHLEGMGEINVEKLKKEADLDSLLSETNCRQIFGVHVYLPVSNFAVLASQATGNREQAKRLIQSIHVYQREVSRIVEEVFGGLRVHFQGSKLHALFYRPINDAKALTTRAVLLQVALKDFVAAVFNPAFPCSDDYFVSGGCDIGDVIGTQDGVLGDRELLFVGSAANHAAKVVGPRGKIRLTGAMHAALPADIRSLCVQLPEIDPAIYEVGLVSSEQLEGLCRDYNIPWDRNRSLQRIEEDRKQFPLTEISYGEAETLIDIDGLSIRNSKQVLAASVFADLSGFTDYVDNAQSDEDVRKAIMVMHAIRKEFARVLTQDFDGVRIQYQGDCVQAILHLPKDDEKAIAKKAARVAAGLQSSMETSLKECLPEAKELHLAVGIDMGTTLVSKLGARGARDRMCLGEAVERAVFIQQSIEGGEVGVSDRVFEALPEDYQQLLERGETKGCYVSKGFSTDRLELVEQASSLYKTRGPVYVGRATAGVGITGAEMPGARRIVPSRTYLE